MAQNDENGGSQFDPKNMPALRFGTPEGEPLPTVRPEDIIENYQSDQPSVQGGRGGNPYGGTGMGPGDMAGLLRGEELGFNGNGGGMPGGFGRGGGFNGIPGMGRGSGMNGIPGMGQVSGMGRGSGGLDSLSPEYAGLADLNEEDRRAAMEALLGPEMMGQLAQQSQLEGSVPGGQSQLPMMRNSGGHDQSLPQSMGGGGGQDQAQLMQQLMGGAGGQGQAQLMQQLLGGAGGHDQSLPQSMGGGGGQDQAQLMQQLMGGAGGQGQAQLMQQLLGGAGGPGQALMQQLMGGAGGQGQAQLMQQLLGGAGGQGQAQLMQQLLGGAGGQGQALMQQLMGGAGGQGQAQLMQQLMGGAGGQGQAQLMQQLMGGAGGQGQAQLMQQLMGGAGGRGQAMPQSMGRGVGQSQMMGMGGNQDQIMQQHRGRGRGQGQSLPPLMDGGRGQHLPGMMRGQGGMSRGYNGNSALPERSEGEDLTSQIIKKVTATARMCTDNVAQGMNTILILDTSESMRGEPLKELQDVVEKYIAGLEDNSMDNGLEENVAVIVFGRQTRIVQHLTNDYSKIRDIMDELQCGGESEIQEALVMTVGMQERGGSFDLNGLVVNSRLIIISDGHFTKMGAAMQDKPLPGTEDEVKNTVVSLAQNISQATGMKICFVPVGSANNDIPDMLVAVTGGEICLAGSASWLSQDYLHHTIAAFIRGQSKGNAVDSGVATMLIKEKYKNLTELDVNAVLKILQNENPAQRGLPGMEDGMGGNVPLPLPGGSGNQENIVPFAGRGVPLGGGNIPQGNRSGLGRGLSGGRGGSNVVRQTGGNVNQRTAGQTMTAPTGSLPSGLFNSQTASNNTIAPAEHLPSAKQNEKLTTQTNISKPSVTSQAPEKHNPFHGQETLPKPSASFGSHRGNKDFCHSSGAESPGRSASGGKQYQTVADKYPDKVADLMEKEKLEEDGAEHPDEDLKKDANKKHFETYNRTSYDDMYGPMDDDDESCKTSHAYDLLDDDDEEITEEKIKELMDEYWGHKPRLDNLPIEPEIGLRVRKGPDWMWNTNIVGPDEIGTVTSIDQEDLGWVHVIWDQGFEEDYRYGSDYEFDVEPVQGGMDAVQWPPGKARIIKGPEEADEIYNINGLSNELNDKLGISKGNNEEESPKAASSNKADDKSKDTAKEEKEEEFDESTTIGLLRKGQRERAAANPPSGKTCYIWQYQTDGGDWRNYTSDIQKNLESVYVKRKEKGTCLIDFSGENERVVFSTMEQRNVANKHKTRKVRRKEADANSLKELEEMWARSEEYLNKRK